MYYNFTNLQCNRLLINNNYKCTQIHLLNNTSITFYMNYLFSLSFVPQLFIILLLSLLTLLDLDCKCTKTLFPLQQLLHAKHNSLHS